MCAACHSGDDDDSQPSHQPAADAGKDAGDKGDAGAAPQHPGSKTGFGMYHGDNPILELDDGGRPIVRDGSVPSDTTDGGGFGGVSGSGGDGSADNGDSGVPTPAQLDVPADPGARGPWTVGVRTLQVDLGSGRSMPAEVWYPAAAKSAEGKKPY
ncbi:MAG: hypothetical protein ACOYD1_13855, partial [Candidatus Nanopelagicales bacterium]